MATWTPMPLSSPSSRVPPPCPEGSRSSDHIRPQRRRHLGRSLRPRNRNTQGAPPGCLGPDGTGDRHSVGVGIGSQRAQGDRQTEAERDTPGKRAQDRGTKQGPDQRLGGGSVGTRGAPPELGCPGSPAVFLHVLLGRVSYLYVWLLQVSPVVYELLVATCGIQFPTGETRD